MVGVRPAKGKGKSEGCFRGHWNILILPTKPLQGQLGNLFPGLKSAHVSQTHKMKLQIMFIHKQLMIENISHY